MKKITQNFARLILTLGLIFGVSANSQSAESYPMSSGNYSEGFADIQNWTNNFASGTGAQYYQKAATATNSTVQGSTVFATNTTGGVQKGIDNIILLATGTNSSAFDLLLDFAGTTPGTITFDYLKVVNLTASTRTSDIKLQYSLDNGASFTDFTGYDIPRINNSIVPELGSVTISIPDALKDKSVIVRFFVWNNGQSSGSGNRPKFAIDNVAVTATKASSEDPSVTVLNPAFTVVEPNGTETQNIEIGAENLTGNLAVVYAGAEEFSIGNISSIAQSEFADGKKYILPVAFSPKAIGSFNGTITISGGGLAESKIIALQATSKVLSAADIAGIKSLDPSDTDAYHMTGKAVVTFVTKDKKTVFVQDDSGAILLYDGNLTYPELSVGDEISGIKGTLKNYNGLLEIIATAAVTKDGTKEVVVTEKALDSLTIADQSKLILIKDATIDAIGIFATQTNYTLKGSEVVLRTQYAGLDYIGTVIPSLPQNITAIVVVYNNTIQLVPRSLADMETATIKTPTLDVKTPVFSETITGEIDTQAITIKGYNLTGTELTIAFSAESSFNSDTVTTVPVSGAMTENGYSLSIIFAPLTAGLHEATLTISGGGIAVPTIIALIGNAALPELGKSVITEATDITDKSFTANWSAADEAKSYEINVYTGGKATILSDLIISEYVEGSGNNKALEIYNGTGKSVDLSAYSLKKETNGAGGYKGEVVLSGTLENGKTFVVVNNTAGSADLKAKANLLETSITGFNGNDAVGLFHNGTLIDAVGVVGQVADWGKDVTLTRKNTITEPKAIYDINDWNTEPIDSFDNLGTFALEIQAAPVSGYPKNVGNVLTYKVEGLTQLTTYNYTITAIRSNEKVVSDEATILTKQTIGLEESTTSTVVYTAQGQLIVNTTAGTTIEVYNALGQQITNVVAEEGENTIAISGSQIVIVKVGNKVVKIAV